MFSLKYANLQDAYLDNLRNVYEHPEFINKPRGNVSKETLNLSFIITNPIDRYCTVKTRKSNIIFNFAEALWYLSGSNELSFIEYYANNMAKYSADGSILTGTAYGPKIFSYGEHHINQWARLIELFKEDRDSKRAFISIFDPHEDLSLHNIDVSCTIGLQFFIREDALFLSTFMRANDAYRGLLSDVFSFTFLQEVLAAQLGLQVGHYCHNVATTHIYDTDFTRVEALLATPLEKTHSFELPRIPLQQIWENINTVLRYEQQLREGNITLSSKAIHDINVAPYWKQIIFLFALYQRIVKENCIDFDLFHNLNPLYQYLVQNKWENLFKEISKNGNVMER